MRSSLKIVCRPSQVSKPARVQSWQTWSLMHLGASRVWYSGCRSSIISLLQFRKCKLVCLMAHVYTITRLTPFRSANYRCWLLLDEHLMCTFTACLVHKLQIDTECPYIFARLCKRASSHTQQCPTVVRYWLHLPHTVKN